MIKIHNRLFQSSEHQVSKETKIKGKEDERGEINDIKSFSSDLFLQGISTSEEKRVYSVTFGLRRKEIPSLWGFYREV
jgi:hypothetical protein